MSVSERINQAQLAARERGEMPNAWSSTQPSPLAADGVAEFKVIVHEALFDRLGMRLFEATSEEKTQALVVDEIESLMNANESALSPQERQFLVRDIARDVMGLGPIEQFLADPTVSEVMVNARDTIYVERGGIIERTDVHFMSEEHLRRVVDRIVSRSVAGSTSRRRWSTPGCPTAHVSTPSSRRCARRAVLTIRKFAADPFQVDDLVAMGSLNELAAVSSTPWSRAA